MRKSLTISIPKPCHENWDAMTPQEKGRHCQVCEKTVYDFTNKTDEQIVKTFEKNDNLCGRFKSQQLNREIALRRKDKNNLVSIAASGLFAFLALGTQEANAQGQPQIVQTEPIKHDSIKGKVAHSVLKEKVVEGTVLAEDNLPLPGANVIVKGTDRGVQTDFDGNFAIKLKVGEILEFSFIGYKTKEVIIKNVSVLNIVLREDEELMSTGIVVVGYAVVDPDYEPPYVYTPEELEEKKKREFRRKNGLKFYKRKAIEDRNKKREQRKEARAKKKKHSSYSKKAKLRP